jgi:EmrB/QacA subfamily drug resistance transporter
MTERLEQDRGVATPMPVVNGRMAIILTSAGQFLATLDLFIVNTAFPAIRADFPGTTNTDLSWVLSAYAIVFAALLVPAGRLADRYGRRRLFRIGMALFAVASAGCALSPWLELLVAWRAVQAAGAALMVPTSLGLLLAAFPARRHRAMIGIWSAAGAVGSAVGPAAGGLLADADWRWIFVVNVPIAAVVVYLARTLDETRDREDGGLPDLVGAALFAVGIAAAVAALTNSTTWDTGIWVCVAISLLTLGAFVWRSIRHPRPAIDLRLLRQSRFASANLAMICFFTGFAGTLLGVILFMTTVWHYGSIRAGLAFVPAPVIAIPAAIMAGRLSTSRRTLATIGSILWGAGALLWFVSLSDQPGYAADLFPGTLLCGIGFGIFNASIISAGTAVLPATAYATGTGIINTSRQIGSAAGVALVVTLVSVGVTEADYQSIWVSIVGCQVLAALFSVGTGADRT